MDISEKKKEYDALKALSRWIGLSGTALFFTGMFWLGSFNILVIIGLIVMFAGTSLQFYARYRFGLIKSFRRWMIIQGIYTVLIITLVITLIAIDFPG